MVLGSRKNLMGQVKSKLWTFRKKRTAVLNAKKKKTKQLYCCGCASLSALSSSKLFRHHHGSGVQSPGRPSRTAFVMISKGQMEFHVQVCSDNSGLLISHLSLARLFYVWYN